MARCIVRMLMGPRGTAAANPTIAEIKNSDEPGWGPERILWANMVPVHTGNGEIMHVEKRSKGRWSD